MDSFVKCNLKLHIDIDIDIVHGTRKVKPVWI